MTYQALEQLVIIWAKNRKIIGKATPGTQTLKASSEMGELCDAVIKGNITDIHMELGDVIVTLIILAEMYGADISECLELAYDKISKRKGESLANGVFVKSNSIF